MQVKSKITKEDSKKKLSNEGGYWENTRKEITKDGFMEEYWKE